MKQFGLKTNLMLLNMLKIKKREEYYYNIKIFRAIINGLNIQKKRYHALKVNRS